MFNLDKNGSGCADPTALRAIREADKVKKPYDPRISKLVDTIHAMCELAGFDVEGRICLRDKENGNVWR